MPTLVSDLLTALDSITRGRCVKTTDDYSAGANPFVLTRSSNIPGKAITELPGLVFGKPDMHIKKVAIMMTMTESAIELAASTGVDALVAHHPVADGANVGGSLIKTYLGLYNIALFELHEAFHGLHNGGPFLHGHQPIFTNINVGGVHGNVVYVGDVFPQIKTLGDLKNWIDQLIDVQSDEQMLAAEKQIRKCPNLYETSISARCTVLVGTLQSPVKRLIHMFPHAGFTAAHLEALVEMYPDVDTVLAASSRVYTGHALLNTAKQLGLNFICGNSHAMEIFENGLPLAKAIKHHLPELEVVIFRERMTSFPEESFGSLKMQEHANNIVDKFFKN